MARIIVGLCARRDADGNFMPALPIYRDFPGDVAQADLLPLGQLADHLAKKYQKALREGRRAIKKEMEERKNDC